MPDGEEKPSRWLGDGAIGFQQTENDGRGEGEGEVDMGGRKRGEREM